jgi:hypothetical protein
MHMTRSLKLALSRHACHQHLQVPDVEKFMAEYNMQCPMAAKRLIYSGMPATVEHGKPRYLAIILASTLA